MRRKPLPNTTSKRIFTRTAQKVHPKNSAMPMRGGIRL